MENLITTHPTVLLQCVNRGGEVTPDPTQTALMNDVKLSDFLPVVHVANGSVGSVLFVRCRQSHA